jgi:hypothetical protein
MKNFDRVIALFFYIAGLGVLIGAIAHADNTGDALMILGIESLLISIYLKLN